MSAACYCDDVSTIWNEKRVVARKEHVCYECGEKIEKGDEYVRIGSLFDGRWDTYKICEYCDHDWGVLRKLGYCQLVGGLAETWDEAYRYTPKLERA